MAAVAALCLTGSACAQSQWWWERFDAAAKANLDMPASGAMPALTGNPTGANVKLNKSNSTQPALIVMGSTVGGVSGSGYVTTDLRITVSNELAVIPVNSVLPNYRISVTNAGTSPAAAAVSYTSAVTGSATLNLGSLSCLSAPAGGACLVSGTPAKATVSVPAGGTVILALPAVVGTGLGSVSLTGVVIANVGVVDTNLANNVSTLSLPVVAGIADIGVDVTDGNQTSILADSDNTYTIELSNQGPSAANISMPLSVSTTGSTSYSISSMTLTGTGGASGSTTTGIYSLPADSSVTITMVARPRGAGTIKVSASASITTPNTTDPDTSDNSSSDTDSVTIPPLRPPGVPASAPVYTNNLAGAGAYEVIFGNGTFFAMSTDPSFNVVSVDGLSWYKVPRPFPTATQMPMYGEGLLIETMADAALGFKYGRSADNGQTWSIGNFPVGLYIAQTYAEGRFVAIAASDTPTFTAANSDTAVYSNDGGYWSVRQMPYSVRWYDLVNNGRTFAAVSLTDNRAAYSRDGQSWNAVTLPGNSMTGYGAISAGGGKFVALSRTGGIAASSSNAQSWSSSSVTNIAWSAIAYGNNKFAAIAEGSNVLATSSDGRNWTYTTPVTGNRTWKSLAFGNGVFVGVATDTATPLVFQ